jgi:hypothetical protein
VARPLSSDEPEITVLSPHGLSSCLLSLHCFLSQDPWGMFSLMERMSFFSKW